MKTQFTFGEVAKIFAQVEKVEESAKQFATLTEKYNTIDALFDNEFAKYNYTFFRAPKELHTMFEDKCEAMKERDKAERKAYRAIVTFGELIGIGCGYTDITEDRVEKYINGSYKWEAPNMVSRVKHLALTAAKRINLA